MKQIEIQSVVLMLGDEAMDTNPIVTSASSCRSDPLVVSAAVANGATDCGVNAVGEEAMVSGPSVTSASHVVAPPVVPTAVATAAVITPTTANAALDTAVVGSTSTQAGEASLRTAPNPVPSAAAPGAASAPSGTRSGSDTDHIVGRGTGSSSGGTEVCRYHKYRRCIRGVKCKYRHPITCQNLTDFGVCKDRKCNFIHQQVCRYFWNSGLCVRDDCGYIHPTKIRQSPPVDNRYRNGWNEGHSQNRKDQNHASYGHRHRDRGNNGYSYQGYKPGPSHGPQNIETNFLHQHPMMNIEWRMEELMARLERSERDRMDAWHRRL